MKYLLDTHLLLWASVGELSGKRAKPLSATARKTINDLDNELYFSPASLWEVAIKNGLGRKDFQVDPHLLRRGLLDNGYLELPILGTHVVEVASMPQHHADPFDRLLLAQAAIEGMRLLTHDAQLEAYAKQYPLKFV